MVAQSQIGFIDFIVEPTFSVLTEMIERIVTPLIEEASGSGVDGFRRSSVNSISGSDGKHSCVKSTGSEGSCSLTAVDFKNFKVTWNQEIRQNKETWKALAAKDQNESAKKEEEDSGKEETDAEEKKEPEKTVDKRKTGQEMKTDVDRQEEEENRREWEEQRPEEEGGHNNLTDGHPGTQQWQCQNDPQPDCPLIHYYKRPSYCASSYLLVRSKVNEMWPIDARGKARRLRHISLRRRK